MALMHFCNIPNSISEYKKLEIFELIITLIKQERLKYFEKIPYLYLLSTVMNYMGGLRFLRDAFTMYYDSLFSVKDVDTSNVDTIFRLTQISLADL